MLRQLNSCRPHRAGRAVDEDPLALEPTRGPQAVQRQKRPVADRARFLEAHPGGHVREREPLRDAHVLRVRARAEREVRQGSEHSVADLELPHRRPERLDLTRELVPENLPLRPPKARQEPADERLAGPKVGVGAGYPRRADPDEDLVGRLDRLGDVLDPQHVRGPIPVVDGGLHRTVTGRRRWRMP